MSTHTKKQRRVLIGAAFLLGPLIAGCGHGTTTKSAPPSSEEAYQKALVYARCVRAHGVPDFPDPQQDGQGGITQKGGRMKKAQKALEACRDKMPQVNADGLGNGHTIDSAKLADWAKCMRAKGLPNFPDPDVSGNTFTIKLSGTGISGVSSGFNSALRACQSHLPPGNMKIEG